METKKAVFWLLVLGVLLALPALACEEATPATYRVKYRVSGTTREASVTYNNAQGGTEQRDVSVPWETSLTVKGGHFLYLSAQNQQDHGSIVAEILVNGKTWKKSESSGAYKIASCSGSAGSD